MAIIFSCSCGKRLRAQERAAGKRLKCPACGNAIVVPEARAEPEAEEQPDGLSAPPSHTPPPVDERAKELAKKRYAHLAQEPPKTSLQEYAYWAMLVALVPLAFSLLQARDDTLDRIVRSIEKSFPKEKKAVKKTLKEPVPEEGNVSFDDLIARMPEGRVEGAFLPRKTLWHWVYGLLAAGLFLGCTLFLFPADAGEPLHLLLIGLFTATIGILLLLLAQFLADWAAERIVISRNFVIMILFWIAWAIGFSYRAALDPDIDFVPSFLGFTFGVGFCEEVCKVLPLLWYYRVRGALPWRTACTWGFASGVGFGVSEGIMYSANFYNGVSTGDIYLVRFVSCVALHAIWSASAALFIHKYQAILQADFAWYEYIPRAMFLVGIPMILHGLYDTLLKRDLNFLALVTGLVSFAWFAWSIENARKREEGLVEKKRPTRQWA